MSLFECMIFLFIIILCLRINYNENKRASKFINNQQKKKILRYKTEGEKEFFEFINLCKQWDKDVFNPYATNNNFEGNGHTANQIKRYKENADRFRKQDIYEINEYLASDSPSLREKVKKVAKDFLNNNLENNRKMSELKQKLAGIVEGDDAFTRKPMIFNEELGFYVKKNN